jgi:hypothetical protein
MRLHLSTRSAVALVAPGRGRAGKASAPESSFLVLAVGLDMGGTATLTTAGFPNGGPPAWREMPSVRVSGVVRSTAATSDRVARGRRP